MKYNKNKIFWIARNTSKDVICIPWDEKEEYYSFIKRKITDGYHQLSVTSEIMLDIISTFMRLGTWKVDNIEMMEDDRELNNILDGLIDSVKSNANKILDLYEYLSSITKDSSIEVKRIYLSSRGENGELSAIFIQVNGIVGTYNCSDKVNTMICQVMREYI